MDNNIQAVVAAAANRCGSYYKLAKLLGVAQSTVSMWRHGKKQPNGPHLMEMLKIAGKLAAAVVMMISATLPYSAKEANADQGKIDAPYTNNCCGASKTAVYYVKLYVD